MKCQYCNSEIPDDSVFCPECGQKQTVSPQIPSPEPVSVPKPISETAVCPVCGTPIEHDALFCPECGTPLSSSNTFSNNTFSRQKKSNAPVIIAVIIGVIVLITILITVAMLFFRKGSSYLNSITQEPTIETTEPGEDDILSDVDFNLLYNDFLLLEGLIKKTDRGEAVLQLDSEYSFYGEDFDGTEILLEDARNAYIDESALPDGMLDDVRTNQTVTIDGQLYFDNEKLYITPFTILDENGDDLIEAFEKKQEKSKKEDTETKALTDDYILPQSNTRLLTNSDVNGLDIRKINYAKNEIYARHGRLFNSAELQNYFNSKSWYRGTVSPENFNNSMLSDIEQKNAEFLSDIEFSMNPGGYQLDAD